MTTALSERGYACRVTDRRYTCMSCNKAWGLNDDGFVYFRPFGATNWLVREGVVQPGDRMNVVDADTGEHVSGGHGSLGWFAHCADKEACARRRRNNHNGVPSESLSLFPPCPCECNSGGFCGGCGHAGCGGRR